MVKFLKSPEGIIPSLCRTLTELRKQVKREMKNLPKDDAYARGILNSKQLALKLTYNSLYGSMGFSKGLLFHSDAAQANKCHGGAPLCTKGQTVHDTMHLRSDPAERVLSPEVNKTRFQQVARGGGGGGGSGSGVRIRFETTYG